MLYNPLSGVSSKNDKKVELSENDSTAITTYCGKKCNHEGARKTKRNFDKDNGNDKINTKSTGCDAMVYNENHNIYKT
eukprot:1498407-Ditylum_brightwellii.AAC.1